MLPIIHELRKHIGAVGSGNVSDTDISGAERRLKFSLPELVREIYTSVGDGGFGPGYGFLPLLQPIRKGTLRGDSVVELYEVFRGGDPQDPTWPWPERMLPLVDWGCAIRSCVDCSTDTLRVLRDEPDVSRLPESPSLEQWLSDWIAGRDLWRLGKA